jgi:DNA-binding protein H-NS
MASLHELISQKEALERQIEQAQQQGRRDAVAQIRSLMSEYGVTAAELSSKAAAKPRGGKGNKVPAKYRNSATGDAWSGRGLQPKWLKAALASGRKLADFAV